MANKGASKSRKRTTDNASLRSRSKHQKGNMLIEPVTVQTQSTKQQQSLSAPLSGRKDTTKAQSKIGQLGVPQGVKRKDAPLSATPSQKTSKRQKSPGVRIVGGRIYDSENGQTCHQCRQKTIEFMAPCKNATGNKVCSQKFCPKCLLNRYGEKVEEVVKVVDWLCPRCQGICNCSICMKKKGCPPTGILSHTAKATGFGSVADFLKQGLQKSMMNVFIQETLPQTRSSLTKCDQQRKETQKKLKSISKSKGSIHQQFQPFEPEHATKQCAVKQKDQQVKGGKKKHKAKEVSKGYPDEQSHSLFKIKNRCGTVTEGNVTETVKQRNYCASKPHLCKKQKASKISEKCECFLKKQSVASALGKNKSVSNPKGNCKSGLTELSPYINASGSVAEVLIPEPQCKPASKTVRGQEDELAQRNLRTTLHLRRHKVQCLSNVCIKAEGGGLTMKEQKLQGKDYVLSDIDLQMKQSEIKEEILASEAECCFQSPKAHKFRLHQVKVLQPKLAEQEIVLPEGDQLHTVAGVELPENAIGPALQLLEFCSAFEEALGLKKGQAENILRELVRGGVTRRGTQSQLAQLHVKLLTFIEDEDEEPCKVSISTVGKNSWLRVLRKHFCERSCLFTRGNKDLAKSTKVDIFIGTNFPESASPLRLSSEIIAPMSENHQTLILKTLDDGGGGYMALDVRTKLWLLNMLCDDCLCTLSFRSYIEDAMATYEEKQKEIWEEVLAAKKEAKEAIQKKKVAEVKRLLAMQNIEHAPLTLDEQCTLLSKVKQEAENAHAARLALSQVASKISIYRHDAVRTEPIMWEKHGRAFWRMKGSDSGGRVVLQDIINTQSGAAVETWSIYSKEHEELLVKYVTRNSLRKFGRKDQGHKLGEESPADLSDMPMEGSKLPHKEIKVECKGPLHIPKIDFANLENFHSRMEDELYESKHSEGTPKERKPVL